MISHIAETYLNRFSEVKPKLNAPIKKDTGIIVVIPCYNEPDLIKSLQSLNNCIAPDCRIEVITVINASEKDPAEIHRQNEETLSQALVWAQHNKKEFIDYHFIFENKLPHKHAGVGLARKIGMDEAVRRFMKAECNGIIACYDADCTCSQNYLTELYNSYKQHHWNGCSIYFEHPLGGNEYPETVYAAIAAYELFLRYYRQMLKYCGVPYACHTIGSSMAVSCEAYCKQGGMNKRKAGEDFYFLNKIMHLGNFYELNSTMVYPSPRTSNRVPFGTGKAVHEILNGKKQTAYNPIVFEQIKKLTMQIGKLYHTDFVDCHIPNELKKYLISIGIEQVIEEIRTHTSNTENFIKRFYVWFDGLRMLKCIHYMRDTYFSNLDLLEASIHYLSKANACPLGVGTATEVLTIYRELDRK